MPYDPGIQYIGGQLLGQGIGQFGQAIGAGLEEQRKLQQQAAEAAALYSYAKANNLVTPDQEIEWAKGSLADKVGLGEGWAKTTALAQGAQIHREQMQNALEVARIHADAARAAYPTMSAEDFANAAKAAETTGYTALPTGDRRGVQYVPKPFDVGSATQTTIPGDPSQGIPPAVMFVDKYGRSVPKSSMLTQPPPSMAQIMGGILGVAPGTPGAAGGIGYGTPQQPPIGAGGGAPGLGNIPQPAIDALKQDPTKRQQFDQYYGTGASAAILGY